MTTAYFNLASGNFSQDWSNAGLITANDDWSGVASIQGYLGDGLTSSTNVDARSYTGSNLQTTVDVVANQSNPASASLAGGVLEFDGIANPTIALNGSGTADAPSVVFYVDATGRSAVRFQAALRDLDASADDAAQQIAVQYRVGGGIWQNIFYDADVSTANSATEVTAVDVTLGTDADNAAQVEIRVLTTNAAGNDEATGIDDIVISSQPGSGTDSVAPTITGATPADNSSGVNEAANIVLSFSEAVTAVSGNFTISDGAGDVRVIAVSDTQVSISGNTVTINPVADLAAGTHYTVTADAGIVEDAAGNDFAGLAAGALDFTTAAPVLVRSIGVIQGLGHTSSFVGQVVRTEGVVTAIDSNGYYIQSAVGAGDGDSRTSDGLFVFTSSAPAGVAVGDLLRVDGTVAEFRPGGSGGSNNLTTTELVSATSLKLGTASFDTVIIGNGFYAPPTEIIDNDSFATYDPAQDGIDFYESLEGMLVSVDAPRVVGGPNGFDEVFVVASDGVGATGLSARGTLVISNGDFNPEKIQLDADTGLYAGFDGAAYSVGDKLASVSGIVSYAFGGYEVLVTQAVTITQDVTLAQDVTSLVGAADKLSIGNYNVENLDPTDAQIRFDTLAEDIVNNLRAPDIIGLQEVQDADGAGTGSDLTGTATAAKLIAAIVAAGGPLYSYVEVAPVAAGISGGEPGGNIRNGYLYNDARVDYVAGSAVALTGAAFTDSRPPLSAQFVFNGETVTAINLHSTSRGGSNALNGNIQPPVDGGDAARTAQATAVRSYVDGILALDANANIIVQGDMNGFSWESALGTLTAGGALTDLDTLLPATERYSYVFDGNAQQLDHLLVSQGLLGGAQFDAVHLNAELPNALQVASDHDALVALVEIPVKLFGSESDDLIEGSAASEVIYGNGGNDVLRAGGGNDSVFGGNGHDTIQGGGGVNVLDGGAGNDVFGGEAQFGRHSIDGGAGADSFIVNSDGSPVMVDLAAGTVTGGYADGSTLVGVELVKTARTAGSVSLSGDGVANALTGGSLDDVVDGRGGNDKLTGGKGADTLIGGAGNDKFIFQIGDVEGDTIADFLGTGHDTLIFEGFGPGAHLTNVDNDFTIHYGAGQVEHFTMNVTTLAPGDVLFG